MKFIFKVTIKKGHTVQEYIDAWTKGSSVIQTSEGSRGTILYRKIDEPNTLIAIAEWESKEARDAAMAALDQLGAEIQIIRNRHKDYGQVEVIGNFEEVGRVDHIQFK